MTDEVLDNIVKDLEEQQEDNDITLLDYKEISALLGINKKMMENSRKTVPYTRILGYSDKGKYLISEIMSQNPKLNLVTSVKDFLNTNKNKILKEMLETDIYSTNIYTLGYEKDSWSNLDYTNKIVTLQDLKEKK